MSRIMLNIARALCAAGVVTAGGLAQAQTIVKPAQVNEQTSHRYVMINAASWEAAQSWARALGGDLVTIDDAAENLWVWNTFSTTASKYMIGLKADNAGNLAWSDGSSSAYRNWDPGEPQVNSTERYACVLNQKWAIRSTNYSSFYVVEWSTSTIRVPEEFPALTDALNILNAMGGGEVLVGPGTFTIPATITLTSVAGKGGMIKGAGVGLTQIRYTGASPGIALSGDWTIRNATWQRLGNSSLFFAKKGFIQFEDVTVDGQFSTDFWGVFQIDPAAQVSVRRSHLTAAHSMFGTGSAGAFVQVSDSVIDYVYLVTGVNLNGAFSNCTLANVGMNGLSIFLAPAKLANSVIWYPAGTIGDVTATHCNYQSEILPGEGNISQHPQWDWNSYTPSSGSPLINAGSAAAMNGSGLDILGNPRLSGAPDIGAIEFQAASCDADFNQDGFLDFSDFDDFVQAFESGC